MCINHPNYLEALETVLSWDIPDEAIPLAVADQAKLMSGFDYEQPYINILQ
ncbi:MULTISPECIES: hypothetical protein [unclassified Methylophilus]|uniref:hypothetical protein n=1 Tax=unclassified Methylophilus TaxID=2630143 RepID=UPI0012E36644|nr:MULTISPECIES: hypothetical protein [unclassified Methylophilus]